MCLHISCPIAEVKNADDDYMLWSKWMYCVAMDTSKGPWDDKESFEQ